jgi:hypothetical protein
LKGVQVPLGFITATVPNSSAATSIYRGKDLLHLSGISINSGGILAAAGDAVHLVAYVGDADGNGAYSSGDAVLITRVLVSTDTGFAAYPLVDPTIVADTDGSGFIPSDAALQANEAGVGFATATLANPPIPPGANVTPAASNAEHFLSAFALAAKGNQPQMNRDERGNSTGRTTGTEKHLRLSSVFIRVHPWQIGFLSSVSGSDPLTDGLVT